jgi:hypothetical protein
MDDIDFVIPWVDGSEPEWRNSYEAYSLHEDKRFNYYGERYRDWGLLRYWFRGVEKYAPWVRTIHFVTCGQVPDWLNLDHPKLHVAKHSDYIAPEYLPTFSSRPIELNFHRIPGLTERFVYFNDDMFLSAPVRPSDFFKNGLPRAFAIRGFVALGTIGQTNMNDVNLINSHFDYRKSYKENLWKWYSLNYGMHALRSLYFFPYKDFTGTHIFHLPSSFLKSTYIEVWSACEKEMAATCGHRFRSMTDVNQWLLNYWQIVSGNFYPQNRRFGRYYTIDRTKEYGRVFVNQSVKTVCLNDNGFGMSEFEELQPHVLDVFRRVFPERSSFERNDE